VKNIKRLGILFLFLAFASSLFATVSEKPRQGLVSIFEDLQPASEAAENVSNAGVQPFETVTPRHANQFTGRRWDSFSQTYNHRNRQYNPKYGRWISKDQIGFAGGLNLWGYCNNNPARWADPFGLFWVSSWIDHVYTQGNVTGALLVPYPRPIMSWPPVTVGTSFLWVQTTLSDYWLYQKIWVPEPPCFDVYPSQAGIAKKHDVALNDYWPVVSPPPVGSFLTSDRAEYHRGHTTYPVP